MVAALSFLHSSNTIKSLLEYYMGKNTLDRQNFIIDNLRVEKDMMIEKEVA